MASTIITIDTFGNSASIFIRDVLRQNIVDTQSPIRTSNWIFKGEPEDNTLNYPYVVISTGTELEPITGNNARRRITNFKVDVQVWAHKINDRDSISDQIIKVLNNPNSADSNGDTLGSKRLFMKNVQDSDNDGFKTDTEFVRIKTMTLNFSYGGA